MTTATPDPRHTPHRDTESWPAELFSLPNDPALTARDAPHETAGVMRMHRGGMPGPQITEVLRSNPLDNVDTMYRALEDEAAAKYLDIDIWDAVLTPEEAATLLAWEGDC